MNKASLIFIEKIKIKGTETGPGQIFVSAKQNKWCQ